MSEKTETAPKVTDSKAEAPLQSFYFPAQDLRVQAISMSEAEKIVNQQIKEGK